VRGAAPDVATGAAVGLAAALALTLLLVVWRPAA
jgi:hypothetical protein